VGPGLWLSCFESSRAVRRAMSDADGRLHDALVRLVLNGSNVVTTLNDSGLETTWRLFHPVIHADRNRESIISISSYLNSRDVVLEPSQPESSLEQGDMPKRCRGPELGRLPTSMLTGLISELPGLGNIRATFWLGSVPPRAAEMLARQGATTQEFGGWELITLLDDQPSLVRSLSFVRCTPVLTTTFPLTFATVTLPDWRSSFVGIAERSSPPSLLAHGLPVSSSDFEAAGRQIAADLRATSAE